VAWWNRACAKLVFGVRIADGHYRKLVKTMLAACPASCSALMDGFKEGNIIFSD